MNVRFLPVLALAMSLAIPAAHAAPSPAARAVTVKYGDLDLSKPAGMSTLHQRLSAAANLVCSDGMATSLTEALRRRQCRGETLARALQAINHPVLLAAR